MKISIIIPVYNTAKYLRKCFDSIVNQTHKDIEVIVIDDGSFDGSEKICDEYKDKYTYFNVVHKSNEGQAIARNQGLKIITGDYAMFVDSDDYIDENAVEFLSNEIENNECDVLFYTDYVLHDDGSITSKIYPYPDHILQGDEIKYNFYPHSFGAGQRKNDTYSVTSTCLGIYRTSFLKENNILFEEKGRMMCEDVLFNMKVATYTRRVGFINKPLYTYRMHSGTTTHSYDEKKLTRTLELFYYQDKYNKEAFNLKEARIRTQDFLIANITSLLKVIYKSNNEFKKKINDIKQVTSDKRIKEALYDYPFNELILTKKLIIELTIKNKPYLVYLLLKLRDLKKN